MINGGAYGVDEAALRATASLGGRAVVVLPCGVDRNCPIGNATLFDSIVGNGGLLVSEYSPGREPARARFAARARLLAALGQATVVVEAGKRSGTRAVVQAASQVGRPTFGVPGSVYSATSAGVHELIQADLVRVATTAEDILPATQM